MSRLILAKISTNSLAVDGERKTLFLMVMDVYHSLVFWTAGYNDSLKVFHVPLILEAMN